MVGRTLSTSCSMIISHQKLAPGVHKLPNNCWCPHSRLRIRRGCWLLRVFIGLELLRQRPPGFQLNKLRWPRMDPKCPVEPNKNATRQLNMGGTKPHLRYVCTVCGVDAFIFWLQPICLYLTPWTTMVVLLAELH